MGGALDERSKDYFDTLVKDSFKSAQFPSAFTVFDYYFDLKKTKKEKKLHFFKDILKRN
jgi:hypothetical protein